jgi:GLPGLI family protein
MKKIMIVTFCFAFIGISLAQADAICVYKVTKNTGNNDISPRNDAAAQNAKKLINEGIEIAETFKYTLKFNKNESAFRLENSMANDAKSGYLHNIAKALVGNGVYYQNKATNENIHQIKISGGKFLITEPFFADWEITKETKKIGKYQCFKAIKECANCTTEDEVWFTPEIAMPYGPLGYSGLPGLILEVKKKVLTLRLTSIDFKDGDLAIEKPTKGKLVTKEEFKNITNGIRAQAKQ